MIFKRKYRQQFSKLACQQALQQISNSLRRLADSENEKQLERMMEAEWAQYSAPQRDANGVYVPITDGLVRYREMIPDEKDQPSETP